MLIILDFYFIYSVCKLTKWFMLFHWLLKQMPQNRQFTTIISLLSGVALPIADFFRLLEQLYNLIPFVVHYTWLGMSNVFYESLSLLNFNLFAPTLYAHGNSSCCFLIGWMPKFLNLTYREWLMNEFSQLIKVPLETVVYLHVLIVVTDGEVGQFISKYR